MKLATPYYLIDERKIVKNLKKIKTVRNRSGAKSVLALKCFSTWSVFGLMRQYMGGVTASSPHEARLGYEKFGGEVHAYCVAYSQGDIQEIKKYAGTIIFNSIAQLEKFHAAVGKRKVGVRLNPGISYSHFDLADPARKFSRLGVVGSKALRRVQSRINGVLFHFNCENDDFEAFSKSLDYVSKRYGSLLNQLEWVSLGGGLYFTKEGYPLDAFCKKLKQFSEQFGVQVYLEPGESAVTQSAQLVTTVLDIVHNKKEIAIVDASTEAHMLDLLVYREEAHIKAAGDGRFTYMVAGRSCLAGDIFGTYHCRLPLKVGSVIRMEDAAGYTMVKKNWFNGLAMPTIVVKRLNGAVKVIRRFTYKDFVDSLS